MPMPLTSQAAPATQALPVSLSRIMFEPGNEVKARSDAYPFWMTVVSVNERTGFCRCNFGSSGRDAGNFHHLALDFHGSVQLNHAAA